MARRAMACEGKKYSEKLIRKIVFLEVANFRGLSLLPEVSGPALSSLWVAWRIFSILEVIREDVRWKPGVSLGYILEGFFASKGCLYMFQPKLRWPCMPQMQIDSIPSWPNSLRYEILTYHPGTSLHMLFVVAMHAGHFAYLALRLRYRNKSTGL